MPDTRWSFVGSHPEDLADGRMVAPGSDPVVLDAEHPHNAAMIERGVLIPDSTAAAKSAKKITSDKETAS